MFGCPGGHEMSEYVGDMSFLYCKMSESILSVLYNSRAVLYQHNVENFSEMSVSVRNLAI